MRCVCWKAGEPMAKRKQAAWALFGLYLAALLWILFLRRIGDGERVQRFNFCPFYTIGNYLNVFFHRRNLRWLCILNVGGNLLLFVPWGVFLPMLFGRMRLFYAFLLCSCAAILAAEGCQVIFRLGIFDVDDVILNVTGALLGWTLHCVGKKDKKGK